MVSGQNDRNNVRGTTGILSRFWPQWCPAKMTGITYAWLLLIVTSDEASMVSGQNDRNNQCPRSAPASRAPASMVSGQNDRNNLAHVDSSAVRAWVPQWCPAKMTGITTSAASHQQSPSQPQWCPAKMTGITLSCALSTRPDQRPQWCPAKMTGITCKSFVGADIDAASMVSGQNDRNNRWPRRFCRRVGAPQWCPAKMTGITRGRSTVLNSGKGLNGVRPK